MARLFFIQGDTIETILHFRNLENPDCITEVWFSCKSLNLKIKLQYLQDTYWVLKIPASESTNFRVGDFSFDITTKLLDGDIYTVLYQGTVVVKQKVNTVW